MSLYSKHQLSFIKDEDLTRDTVLFFECLEQDETAWAMLAGQGRGKTVQHGESLKETITALKDILEHKDAKIRALEAQLSTSKQPAQMSQNALE